jgi:hypothetical protein
MTDHPRFQPEGRAPGRLPRSAQRVGFGVPRGFDISPSLDREGHAFRARTAQTSSTWDVWSYVCLPGISS